MRKKVFDKDFIDLTEKAKDLCTHKYLDGRNAIKDGICLICCREIGKNINKQLMDKQLSNNKQWINTKKQLPNNNQKVIILTNNNDIQIAIFYKGHTKEECEKINAYSFEDQGGNNLVPYAWKADGGPMKWFGQDVLYWMELPDLPLIKKIKEEIKTSNIHFNKEERVIISGEVEYGDRCYRVASNGIVVMDIDEPKILINIDMIDGDEHVCTYVDRKYVFKK